MATQQRFLNGVLVAEETVADYVPTPEEVAHKDIRDNLQTALDDLDAYLAISNPTAAQVAQQVRRLSIITRRLLVRLAQVR